MRLWLLALLSLLMTMTPVHAAKPMVYDTFPVQEKAATIVIEDAENETELRKVLELARQNDVHLTIFAGGQWLSEHKELAARIVAEKHELGNAGMSRKYWGNEDAAILSQELRHAAQIIKTFSGKEPEFVRPPYYAFEARDIQIVTDYRADASIIRGIDTGDWMLQTSGAVLERVLSTVQPGSIIGINLQAKNAAGALPEMITRLKQSGYQLMALSEMKAKAPTAPAASSARPVRPFGLISRVDVSRPYVALTFDDGGRSDQVAEILKVLRENQAKATFFLLGNWVYDHPGLVRQMVNEGHEVANHSYSHPQLTGLSEEEVRSEIAATQKAVWEVTGQKAAPYFRPPYGAYNSSIVQIVKDMGFEALVTWDIDTRDWAGRSGSAISETVLRQIAAGDIVLFHLHGLHTADALRDILPALQERGYSAVSLSTLRAD